MGRMMSAPDIEHPGGSLGARPHPLPDSGRPAGLVWGRKDPAPAEIMGFSWVPPGQPIRC